MKKRYWLIIYISSIFLQLVLNQADIFIWIHIPILLGWVGINYFGVKFSSILVLFGGLFVELLSFGSVGLYAISFSLGLFVAFLMFRYLNFSDKSYRLLINQLGLFFSVLFYYIIQFFILGNNNISHAILGIIFTGIIYNLLSRLNNRYSLVERI